MESLPERWPVMFADINRGVFEVCPWVQKDGELVDGRAVTCCRLDGLGRERREEKAGEEEAVKRADGGGLGEFAQAEGFLAGADALLARLWGKEVLEEGNNALGHTRQKPGGQVARLCKILRPCFVLLHRFVGAILDQSVGTVKPFQKKYCFRHCELPI